MDWAKFDLRMPNQASLSDDDRETIRQVAEEAIIETDHDPDIVLNAAAKVVGRVDVVENLRAYAKRTIFRALKRATVAKAKKDPLATSASLNEAYGFAEQDSIENVILVRELVEILSPQDREIVIRKMEGEICADIDVAMNLRPRTAEIRFEACKTIMRRALDEKFDPGKSLRVR